VLRITNIKAVFAGSANPCARVFVPCEAASMRYRERMTAREIQAVSVTKPFKPFRIRLSDGESLPVPNPEYFSHSPNWRTVIVWEGSGGFKIVDTALITALEFDSGASADGS